MTLDAFILELTMALAMPEVCPSEDIWGAEICTLVAEAKATPCENISSDNCHWIAQEDEMSFVAFTYWDDWGGQMIDVLFYENGLHVVLS